jgi:hypothetical protein
MRITTLTLIGFIAATPLTATAKGSLWDVPQVDKGLMQIGIAHGVRKNCETIDAHKLNGISYVWNLVGHAKEAGFTMKETRAFIDDDVEKEVLRKRVVKYLKAKGLNPDKSNALCEFGKAEISKKSQVGVLLRMN